MAKRARGCGSSDDRFLLASDRGFKGYSFEEEGRWTGSFSFVQLADSQFGMLHKDETWEEEAALLRTAVDHINRLQPKFVVVCGDLVNAMPDNQEKQELQARDFKAVCRGIDPRIPLVCVCGNHDVGNQPTSATVRQYGARFGDDFFSFWAGGVRFLVLNTQIYRDWGVRGGGSSSRPSEDGEAPIDPSLFAAHETWLDAELSSSFEDDDAETALAAAAATGGGGGGVSGEEEPPPPPPRTIALSHIPPFISSSDEPDGYFNIPSRVRGPLLAKMARGGCCSWFCGHYHRNAGGMFRLGGAPPPDCGNSSGNSSGGGSNGSSGSSGGGGGAAAPAVCLEVVTSSAVGCVLAPSGVDPLGLRGFKLPPSAGVDRSGLRVVRITADAVTHEWFTLDSVPSQLQQQQSGGMLDGMLPPQQQLRTTAGASGFEPAPKAARRV